MIPTDLLDLLDDLKKTDPKLWKKLGETEIATYEQYDDSEDYIYLENLIEPAQEAWIQHCLQEAIRARKWQGIVLFNSDHCRVVIYKFVDGWGGMAKLAEKEGSTEAEALLKVYLQAIKESTSA